MLPSRSLAAARRVRGKADCSPLRVAFRLEVDASSEPKQPLVSSCAQRNCTYFEAQGSSQIVNSQGPKSIKLARNWLITYLAPADNHFLTSLPLQVVFTEWLLREQLFIEVMGLGRTPRHPNTTLT